MPDLQLDNFSGGWSLLDHPAPNESPRCQNMVPEGRALIKRLGYAVDGGMTPFAASIANLFYSNVLDKVIVQEGVNVRKRDSAGSYSLVKAFTTNALVTFAEFKDKLLMLHPVDGLFSYTSGGTLAGPLGPAGPTIKGVDVAAWSNKVWVAVGSAVTADRTRAYFCAPGDETDWTGAGSGSVDLREIDDEALTALVVSQRAGLLAFKSTSSYRIHDSSTGAFTTIDPNTGAPGARAVAAKEDVLALVNDEGLFISDGLSPLAKVSRRIDLFFTDYLPTGAVLAHCASVTPQGRFLFSFDWTGGNVSLEYDPVAGWIVPHTIKATAFALSPASGGTLFHGSSMTVYETFTGGSDIAAAIDGIWDTPPLALGDGRVTRLQRLHVVAEGALEVQVTGESTRTYAAPVENTDIWPRMLSGSDERHTIRVRQNSTATRTRSVTVGATSANLTLGGLAVRMISLGYTPLEAGP